MPRRGVPKARNFFRPWGFSYQDYSAAWDEYNRQKDMDYFEKWGFFPEQRAGVLAAAERGEQDFQSAMESLSGIEDEITGGRIAGDLERYFGEVLSGSRNPFTPGVLASISSRISDPFYRSARNMINQARASFASRGLARSGGLIGLENQYMTDAIARALSEEAGVRSQGAIENANFQQRGMGMYGVYNAQRNAALADLAKARAGLYSQRQHDPVIESLRGAAKRGYKPPPAPQTRANGYSAPTY